MSDIKSTEPEALRGLEFIQQQERAEAQRERVASLLEDKKIILQELLGFIPKLGDIVANTAFLYIDTKGIETAERESIIESKDSSQLAETKEKIRKLKELFASVRHDGNHDTFIVLETDDLITFLKQLTLLD